MRKSLLFIALLTALVLAAVPAVAVGGRPLSADLTGAAEVPGPGDPDGTGSAHVTLNQGQGMVCWDITHENIADPFAAHIHFGAEGVPGGIAVALSPTSGCTDGVDAELIKDIRQNPENYYVNVHNADFPAGAIRGQLTK